MIGQTISHYKIVSKLGEGGMGVVYTAEDLKLKRTVALKFLPPGLTRDKDAKIRFIHEAQAASALQHHNICTIHEIDETEDGHLFIAMDRYDGETLKERLSRGPLPVEEAVEIASQVAAGLSKAHAAGMVHRDIKPANIMVTTDGVAKILDFGLAKLAGMTKVTRTGTTVGTVSYMSPEQASGREVDAPSDVFSLGVVLYEMLAGGTPFKGDHEAALLYQIVNQEPELISSVRKGAPADLDDIVAKMLAKKPEERYPSGAALLPALTALNQELSLGPAGRAGRGMSKAARRRVVRKWLKVGIPFAAMMAMGVITMLYLRTSSKAPNPSDLCMAVVDFRDLVNPDDPATSAGITGLVQTGLTEASPVRVVSAELLYDIRRRLFGSQRGSIEPDQILEVARKAGSSLYLTGQMMGSATDRYITWNLVETKSGKSIGGHRVTGATLVELADGIIKGVLPLLPGPAEGKVPESLSSVSEIVTSSKEAYEHYVKAELAVEDAEKFFTGGRDEAIAELRKAIAIDSTFALAYLQLAAWSSDIADTQDLRNLTEKAWKCRDRLGLRDRMRLEGYREELDGKVPAAMTTYREIHARWPDNRKALEWLAGTAFWYWYLEEALTLSAQGLALYPDGELFLSLKLSALRELGRGEEALQAWIATAREHPTPWVWSELGEIYWTQGFPDSAEACLQRASSVWPDQPGERERKIADCFYARGDVNHAVQMREALLKQPDVNNEHKVTLLDGWANGLVYYAAEIGRFSRSFELLREHESVISGSAKIGNNAAIPGREIYLLNRMGQAAKAVDLARTSLKSMPTASDSLAINLELIEALAAAGSVREARLLLAAVLKLDERVLWGPRRYRALLLRSVVSLAEGDPEGALKVIHETEKVAKPSLFIQFGAAYRETLARAYWKSGRLEEAVSTYQALLKVFGGHAISHYELGQVYEEMGRKAEAKREYSRFLEMWSDADEGLPQLVDARTRLAAMTN